MDKTKHAGQGVTHADPTVRLGPDMAKECLNNDAEDVVKALHRCHAALDGIVSRLFLPDPEPGDKAPPDKPRTCLENSINESRSLSNHLSERLEEIARRL